MSDWTHSILSNDEEHRAFAHDLGYAVLNCGTLETLTYSYAALLTDEHFFGTDIGGKGFADRRAHVIRLLEEAPISEALREQAVQLWRETAEVMTRRNVIAHNPISRVTIDRTNGDLARFVAVVDMAKTTPDNVRHLEANKLKNVANIAESLSQRLSECLQLIEREIRARAADFENKTIKKELDERKGEGCDAEQD